MAVLPLVGRWRVDTTCLVIGTMAPDFEYFARAKQVSVISHSWLGLIAWNLPATLILAAVFHVVVKWPLLLVTPRPIARRAATFALRPWGAWTLGFAASCIVSALIGALTHLLWDGVTHSDGLIAPHVPALRRVLALPWGDMAMHRVIQHASTVIGSLGCLAFVARALLRAEPIELPARPRVWPRLVAVACITTGVGLAVLTISGRRNDDVGGVVVVLLSGALAGTLVASGLLLQTARARMRG